VAKFSKKKKSTVGAIAGTVAKKEQNFCYLTEKIRYDPFLWLEAKKGKRNLRRGIKPTKRGKRERGPVRSTSLR